MPHTREVVLQEGEAASCLQQDRGAIRALSN